MEFSISVIIPVYNGDRFIEKAVKSAIEQPEVFEIVLINDGSTDRTLQIIEKLQCKFPLIKTFHHRNKENKGRSASRNLGIKKASGNYIAFLDADDFYLANRFSNDKKIFQEKSEVDGVYNAIGAHFYREASKEEINELKLFTVNEKINQEDLFNVLISGKQGYFSIDGLTVKRSVFDEVGYFNEELVVAEDTDLIWKMALKCHLEGGIIDKPVAMRGVHDKNVFNRNELYEIYDLKLYESMYVWSVKNKVNIKIVEGFLERIWILIYKKKRPLYCYLNYWLRLNLKTPRLLFSFLGIKYFPVVRLRKKLFAFLYTK